MKNKLKITSNRLVKFFIKHKTIYFIAILLAINLVIFSQMVFAGKVPVAFDYGVYTYQPWKLDYESSFIKPPKAIGHDDIRIFYPQTNFVIKSLKNGSLPFWNPYEFTGNVSLANSQTAVFYPPFFLFLLLSQLTAWSLLSFLIPVIAGIGMYLFLTKLISDKYAAGYGALVYAFSSSIITRTQDGLVAGHSLIWLPWVLYGIEVFFKKRKLKGLLIVTISLCFSMLAGWFQFTFYVYAIGTIYSFFKWKNQNKSPFNKLVLISLPFLASILITSVHWLPSLEGLKHSPRGVFRTPSEFSQNHLMPFTHLVTLIIPGFFGHIDNNTYYGASEFKEGIIAIGLIPFTLVLASLFSKKSKEKLFFILILIATLVLGIKNPISKTILSLNIPLVSTFLPNRIFAISSFALAALSALGFKFIKDKKSIVFKRIITNLLLVFIGFYLSIAALYFYERFIEDKINFSLFEFGIEQFVRISAKESIIPALTIFTAFLAFYFFKKNVKDNFKGLLAILVVLTIINQIYSANRYLYFSEKDHEFPQNPIYTYLADKTNKDHSRFLSLSYSKITSNIPSYYGLYNPEGLNAMYPIWYAEFVKYFRDGKLSEGTISRIEVEYSDVLDRPNIKMYTKIFERTAISLLSHLGIRFIVYPQDYHQLPPSDAFDKVYSHKWHTIYEYKYPTPKAHFVSEAVVSNDKELTLERIFHPVFVVKDEVVINFDEYSPLPSNLTAKPNLKNNSDIKDSEKYQKIQSLNRRSPYELSKIAFENINKNKVTIDLYSPNRVILKVDAKKSGFIVLNDAYFPGWKAFVDGVETQVLRANYAFRAVEVPKGSETIIFEYKPKSFKIGKNVSILSTLIFLVYLAFLYKKDRKQLNSQ